MIVGFTRYSQDQTFRVIGHNKAFILCVMAVGSIIGTFVGGQLLSVVPSEFYCRRWRRFC